MADVTWEGNSKQMLEALIEASPKPFRKMTETKLTEAVLSKAVDGVVTEDTIVEGIKIATPKPFQGQAMKTIEPLKSA